MSPWQSKKRDPEHVATSSGSSGTELYSQSFIPLVRHCHLHACCWHLMMMYAPSNL